MYVIYVYIHIISTKTVCARPHSHVCTVDRKPHQTNFTCFLLHSEHTAETHCTVSHWTQCHQSSSQYPKTPALF